MGDIAIAHVRNADTIRLGQSLEPRGDVDAIAEDIPILLHNIAGVDPNTDVNLLGCLLVSVVSPELSVNLPGTLPGRLPQSSA